MSSLVRTGRLIRAARTDEDVFVLGESQPDRGAAPVPMARASELLASAEASAQETLAAARMAAAALIAEAEANAAAVRDAAHAEGFAAGRAEALAELERYLAVLRQAAEEGKAVRDTVAAQSSAVVARAVALAVRRIVGEYYTAHPERTALACQEALRAAAGQEVLSIRVHPATIEPVRASLGDASAYVRPDDGVEIGGCIIDLCHGRVDATLDARLSLMEAAVVQAGGEVGL